MAFGTTVMVEARSSSSSELTAAESSLLISSSGSEKMVDIFDAVIIYGLDYVVKR